MSFGDLGKADLKSTADLFKSAEVGRKAADDAAFAVSQYAADIEWALAHIPARSPLALAGHVPACVVLEAAAQAAQAPPGTHGTAATGPGLLVRVAEATFPAALLPVETPFEILVAADGEAPPLRRFRASAALCGARAELSFAVLPNVEARPNSEPSRVAELLVGQVDSPVLWEQTVAHMAESGVTRALEIGPGKVLAGLVKRIDKRVSVLSVGDPESVAKVADFLAG